MQFPRIRCSRAYAQHQLRRLQVLYPTLPSLSFYVLESFMLNTKVFITHVFQSFAVKTNINIHLFQSFSLNTNIKYSCAPEFLAQHKTSNQLMCFRVHAQHMKSYIKHIQLAYAQYIKQIIMFMCTGVLGPIYQLKHQSNIISNGAYAHKCQVKIRDITRLLII